MKYSKCEQYLFDFCICVQFLNRTDNAVKNRYNALCTKRSHHALKAVDGFSSSIGIKHHIVESWNDASGFQHEQELKRARRVAQEEEERFF